MSVQLNIFIYSNCYLVDDEVLQRDLMFCNEFLLNHKKSDLILPTDLFSYRQLMPNYYPHLSSQVYFPIILPDVINTDYILDHQPQTNCFLNLESDSL